MLSTWNDSLFEELLLQTGQETVNSLPGDFPQIRVACTGVCAVKDPCCVHHQQHVLQRLRDGLQLCTKVTHTQTRQRSGFNNGFAVNLWTSFLGVIDGNIDSKRQEHDSQSYQSSLYDFSYTLILIKASKVLQSRAVSDLFCLSFVV